LHTATHLLLAWLRKYLWGDVHQRWSNITPERIRFDFSNEEKVEKEVLDKIEAYVNNAIETGFDVFIEEISKEEAKASWVEWSFWEKYPEIVKVYTIKWKDGTIFSRELCWWPHVENSSNMWKFKILKEESSSRGVRRIKAVLER
jgi:alanyl-tRNA synthetase